MNFIEVRREVKDLRDVGIAAIPVIHEANLHIRVIESAPVFMKHRETVQLEAGGSFIVRAPGTGKLGVRATPDNCKVFVDGVFVDYPPIIDRTIAAGKHSVTFEWPDGKRAEEKVQIQAGKPSYVMGRKP